MGYLVDSSSHYILGVGVPGPGGLDHCLIGSRVGGDRLLEEAIEKFAARP